MKVTDQALMQFKNLILENDLPGAGIRIFTTQGCCSPLIRMSVEKHPLNGDIMLTMDGVNFFIESQAEQMLSDITIDYMDQNFSLKGPEFS